MTSPCGYRRDGSGFQLNTYIIKKGLSRGFVDPVRHACLVLLFAFVARYYNENRYPSNFLDCPWSQVSRVHHFIKPVSPPLHALLRWHCVFVLSIGALGAALLLAAHRLSFQFCLLATRPCAFRDTCKDEDHRQTKTRACLPGFELLNYSVNWDDEVTSS